MFIKSQGLRSVINMATGNIGATVVSAVAMIIFSRVLGPTQFGVFSVLFSLLLMLSKVGDAGINIAVQRYVAQNKSHLEDVQTYIRVGSTLKLAIAGALAVIGILAGAWMTKEVLHLSAAYELPVILIFVLSAGVIFYEYVNTVLQGVHAFTLSIVSNWIQSLVKLLVGGVVFITHTTSVLFLTLVYLLSPVLGSIVGFPRLPFSYFVPQWDWPVAKRLLTVTKWTGIAIIAATLADNLDVLLVQNMLNSYETGLYSAAVRIASVASLIAWSLGTVLNVRVASYRDRSHLHAYLKKAVLLALASFVGITALALVSIPAIKYTVGSEFLAASTPLNFLFLATAILTATSPFVALFYLFDKPAYFAYSGIIGTILLLGADLMMIPTFGLLGAAYARILSRLGVLIFTLVYARRSYREEYAQD